MVRQMKESGIEWIGEIPADWSTDRLQWHLEEIKVPNSPVQSDRVLSLTIESGVIPYEEKGNQGNKAKENYEEYKLAYPDTLVVNSMNVIIGAVGISKYFGCVSPVYYVFKANEGTDLRYIYYLFTNIGFQKEMRKYAKGILEIRLRISASDMLRRVIPNPTYKEQCRIADFLDKKCDEIDTVIAKTKATIEEYKKLKLSIISSAVTKGIRGCRPMRDSGNACIGEMPADWKLVKMKYITKQIGDGIHTTPQYDSEGEYYFLNGNSIGKDSLVFKESTDRLTEIEYQKYKQPLINNNTIMITLNGATYGKTSFYNGEKVLLGKSAGFITLLPEINKRFIRYYLQSDSAYKVMELSLCGTTIQNLSLNTLRNFPTPTPSTEEMVEISDYLDKKCAEMDALIEKKTALLTEMEAYKKSVIYEYVTGKKEIA